jgi:hypothetical protein
MFGSAAGAAGAGGTSGAAGAAFVPFKAFLINNLISLILIKNPITLA